MTTVYAGSKLSASAIVSEEITSIDQEVEAIVKSRMEELNIHTDVDAYRAYERAVSEQAKTSLMDQQYEQMNGSVQKVVEAELFMATDPQYAGITGADTKAMATGYYTPASLIENIGALPRIPSLDAI